MGSYQSKDKRQRGSIDVLPSGALRVRVYAGIDPVSKRRNYLTEIIPPGPNAEKQAENARTKLINSVEETTRRTYNRHPRKHIKPLIGREKVGSINADILDSFYAELRRCREHCQGKSFIEHRVPGPHDCTDRCRPYQCKPLAAWTVLKIHFILSGAFKRAVRWGWVNENPRRAVRVERRTAP